MSKPKSSAAFQKAYQLLNPEQKKAVDTLEGPVMVVAGPGTGKTQTIALRIANILRQTDTNPNSILALTFTESAAKEMRQRLARFIGHTAYYVQISTFHGFCVDVIRDNPDYFTIDPSAEPLSALDKLKLFHSFLDQSRWQAIRPVGAPYHYVHSLISGVSNLKREGIEPDTFAQVLDQEAQALEVNSAELKKAEFTKRQHDLTKNRELLSVYRLYQDSLAESKRFDFEDMIGHVTRAFQTTPDLLLSYQERFHYFLVDEYQDTNSAQNRVVQLLGSFWGERANVFVVGDPDQCLPGDTLITTEQGDIPINKIKPGDRVLSAIGKGYTAYVSVTKIFNKVRKAKLITFTLESGHSVTTTDNHKMFCFIPPREMTSYWYVYLMHKRNLGWRMGVTKSLSIRLKLEGDADKIIGIKQCNSEQEAKYYETTYSLKYQIPTCVFKYRGNSLAGKWLTLLYENFGTDTQANQLAQDLGINLNEPHYQRDGTTFGEGRTKINLYMNNRTYKSKYAKRGLLNSPTILHEITIQTKNPLVLQILENKGFKLRNKNIGKGFRLTSTDFSKLFSIAKELEHDLPGIIDIKSSLGTNGIQNKPTRIMQAGNVLVGNYLPYKDGFYIKYARVVNRTESYEELQTYDLEVKPSHNFIANGVVVHNSIYRFQGASTENMLGFVQDYPGATVITLRQNYRSGQSLLDAAHSLIRHNELRIDDVVKGLDPHLHAGKVKVKGLIQSVTTTSSLSEDLYLGETIQGLIQKGVPPTEIVVIYRNNADGPPLGHTLAKLGINYVMQGGGDVLAEPVVQRLLKIFRVIHELRTKVDDPNLFTILHYDIFGIEPLDVLKISRRATDLRATLFDVISNHQLLGELDLKTLAKIEISLTKLGEWQDTDANSTFTQFFETVLSSSGYLNSVLRGPDVHPNISRLNTLFAEVKRMNAADHHLDLAAFLQNLDLMEQNNLRLEESSFAQRDDAITLTTAHSAKGLEWEHVFLYKVYDGLWGNKHNSELFHFPVTLLPHTDLSKKEKNEDERRLFYVALTRAKTHLYLTQAAAYSVFGRTRDVIPSMFLYELGEIKNTELSPAKEADISAHLQQLLTPDVASPQTLIGSSPNPAERAFLQNLVEHFTLSVTALNAYLACPYHFMLNNLIKVPQAKKPHLAFGTAVHAALESFYKELKDSNQRPSQEFLLQAFAQALHQEVLTQDEEGHRLAQGEKILSAYYQFFQDDFTPPIYLEKYARVFLGDIPLSGKIDRIDWLDQSSRSIRVVDYKTGSVKTTGQILGTTQDSSGDLHRQLVFYKLLIILDSRLNLRFGEAELDFVQAPADKGKSGQVRFQISDAEVTELKSTIKHVMAEIRALHFPRTTDPATCVACTLRDHCFPSDLPTGQ